MYTAHERLNIYCKWIFSFVHSEWNFSDYPVRVWRNPAPGPTTAWVAQFLKWPGPVGLGPDSERAIADLRKSYEENIEYRKQNDERPPRPGAKEPLKFIPTPRIHANAKLLREFIARVLGYGPKLFLSDVSSLFDFGDETEVERLREMIRSIYGIETSDLKTAIIADILERIAMHRAHNGGMRCFQPGRVDDGYWTGMAASAEMGRKIDRASPS